MSTPFTGSGRGLSDTDLDEVREEQALGRLLARSVDRGSRHDGADESGTVSVFVDGRGEVQDVRIEPEWLGAVGPSALGEALLGAYRAAGMAAADASLRRFTAAVDAGEVRATTDEIWTEEVQRRAAPPGSYEDLVAAAERARREFAEMKERVAAAQRPTTVTGPAGILRLHLDQGVIAAITVVDRRQAARTSSHRLAAEALALFRAAARGR